MNIKNIILATLSLILLVPSNALAFTVESPKNDEGEYDYRNGLLDDDYIIDKENTDIPEEWYDNDDTTKASLPKKANSRKIKFKYPVKIDKIYLNREGSKTIYIKEPKKGVSLTAHKTKDFEGFVDVEEVGSIMELELYSVGAYAYNRQLKQIDFFGSYEKTSDVEGQANIKGGDLELINKSEPNEPIEIKVGEKDNIDLNPIELKVQDNRLEDDGEWNLKMSGDIESEDDNGNLSIENVVFSNLEQGSTNDEEIEIDESEFSLEEDSSKTITSSDAYEYDVNIKDVEINVPRDIKSNSYTANINFELDNGPSSEE